MTPITTNSFRMGRSLRLGRPDYLIVVKFDPSK